MTNKTVKRIITREELQAEADGKLICATHFNWYGWREEYEDKYGVTRGGYFCWLRSPWDAHHYNGREEDPANESQ